MPRLVEQKSDYVPPEPTGLALPASDHLSRAVAMATPLAFAAGEGAELVAADGTRYLDFVSGFGVTNTGHCHPRVVEAIRRQAGSLLHVSTVGTTGAASRYAARLCALVPIADAKLFFANSGTEAVEAALKLVRFASGRPAVLAFGGGFHGRTLGSLSVSSSKAAFRAGYEPLPGGVYSAPYPRESVEPTFAALEQLFREQVVPRQVAAMIVEPVLGEGGYVVPPDDFLPRLRLLCDEHGILLVVDEVQSGFGRTGRLFACEHTGVEPDLITLGKGIASGLPMGALAGRAELLDAWPPGAHGTTFGGNPVCCAAASATLDVLEEEGLVENAARRGAELLEGLLRLGATAHGRGLMIGVDFGSTEAATHVRERLLESRVIVSTCGPESRTLRLSPPLVLDGEHVARFLEAFAAAGA
ncbi:MAG: aspartate aminotransferase family protein [Actinobacteria bacterium]|nr:aspartate aminotransferase family protein [Actinomycetota bacterium]